MTPRVLVPGDLESALGHHPSVGRISRVRPTIGGFSNLSFYADLDSGETIVVKAASRPVKREDLRREARMLGALEDSDLPTPVIRAHIITADWTITAFDAVAGDIGLNVVQTRDEADLAARAGALAELLRVVHQVVPQPPSHVDLACAHRMETRLPALSERSLPAVVHSSNAALGDPLLRLGITLVHGDFGFHNTVWVPPTGTGVTVRGLLDWEWSGWGSPLTDPAWMWWTLQFRHAPGSTWDAFVEAYGERALRSLGWSAAAVDIVLRAHMAWILSCTEPGSPRESEWCNRIVQLDSLNPPQL